MSAAHNADEEYRIKEPGIRPIVAALILNWNRPQDTIRCIDSLIACAYDHMLLVIVDNASIDSSVRVLGERLNQARQDVLDATLLALPENVGFAGGANCGIHQALQSGADYVLILNNDATIAADGLAKLIDAAHETGAAIVGAVVADRTGSRVRFSQRHWPQTLFGFSGRGRRTEEPRWPSAYVDGAALMARADFLRARLRESRYYFDPDLFMYWEDVDLCRYAWSRGYSCVIAGDAFVYHALAASSGGEGNPRSFYYGTRNRVTIANRWLPPLWRVLFHLYYVPSRLALQLFRLGRMRRGATSAIVHGLIDGYRGARGRWSRHGGPVAETPHAD